MPTVNFIEMAPPQSIAKYVEAFWYCRITEKGILRLLPTASCDLMVYSSSAGMKVVLVGPMTISQVAQVERGGFFVGVRFRPGCRIDVPDRLFSSLKNTKTSIFLPRLASIIHFQRKIQNTLTHEKIHAELQLLVDALLVEGAIMRDSIVDTFLDEVERMDDNSTVPDILNRLPLSSRQFQRRFKQYTCLTPKEFMSLSRRERAILHLKQPGQTISRIAVRHGYFDHAHFSHDFQDSVGVPPTDLEDELTLK